MSPPPDTRRSKTGAAPCRQPGPGLIVGFVEQDRRQLYYISAAYLSDGRILHVHRKVYLPTYRLFDDARFFAARRGVSRL